MQHHAALALADTGVALAQLGAGGAQPAFVEQLVFQVGFDTGELLGLLGLDVQAGFVRGVAFGDLDDVVQAQDFQANETRARAVRVGGVEPAAGVEGLQFFPGELVGRRVFALGELGGHVGGALQVVVVQGEQHAVLAALQVQFQVVGAQVACNLVGSGGGFRGVVGSATVSDHGRVGDAFVCRQFGRADRLGSLCLAKAEHQRQQQGAFGKRDRHMRSPFVEVTLRRCPF